MAVDGFTIPLIAQPRSSKRAGFVQTAWSQYVSVALDGVGDFSLEPLCECVPPLLTIAIDTFETRQPS